MFNRPIYYISFDLIYDNGLREDVIKRLKDNEAISNLEEATWGHAPYSINIAMTAFDNNKRRTLRLPTAPGEPVDYHRYEFYEGTPTDDFRFELYECGDIDSFLIQHIEMALADELNYLAGLVNGCKYTLIHNYLDILPIKAMPLLDNYFDFPPKWGNPDGYTLDEINNFEAEYMSSLHDYALQMNRFFDFKAETCDGDLRRIWNNPDYDYIKDALYDYIEKYS